MEKVEAYKCSHCPKLYQRKHFAIKHEMQCSKNPNNWHRCYDCYYLTVDREVNDKGESIKTFYCEKLEKYMHTCKAEARGFSDKLGTVRMPIECKEYRLTEPF